jgi:hypothetical protein
MGGSVEKDFDTRYPDAGDECVRCGLPLRELGPAGFRIGGTRGGPKLLFGRWAELGEDMVSLEVLACPKCRHVELRLSAE